MCVAIAASWSALSCYFAALLAAASAATCCLLNSLAARLSMCVWSSDSIEGRLLCPIECSVRSLACFSLSGSILSMRYRIFGVSGICSLPILPLALEEAEADPSLRMPELRGSLYLLLDMLPWSPSGVNLFCRDIASPLVAAVCPRAYGIVGGVGVPKLKRVTAASAPVSPCGRVPSPVGHAPPV